MPRPWADDSAIMYHMQPCKIFRSGESDAIDHSFTSGRTDTDYHFDRIVQSLLNLKGATMAPGLSIDIADIELLIEMLSERAAKGDKRALQIMNQFVGALGTESSQAPPNPSARSDQSEAPMLSGWVRWWC